MNNLSIAQLLMGIALVVGLPLALGLVVMAYWKYRDWMDFGVYDYHKSNNTSNIASTPIHPIKPTKTAYTAGLLVNERRCPPRATFFGRLDGVEYNGTGDYEDKYLNIYELRVWNKQKTLLATPVADSGAKTTEMLEVTDNFTQNADITIDLGLKEDNNGKKQQKA